MSRSNFGTNQGRENDVAEVTTMKVQVGGSVEEQALRRPSRPNALRCYSCGEA